MRDILAVLRFTLTLSIPFGNGGPAKNFLPFLIAKFFYRDLDLMCELTGGPIRKCRGLFPANERTSYVLIGMLDYTCIFFLRTHTTLSIIPFHASLRKLYSIFFYFLFLFFCDLAVVRKGMSCIFRVFVNFCITCASQIQNGVRRITIKAIFSGTTFV